MEFFFKYSWKLFEISESSWQSHIITKHPGISLKTLDNSPNYKKFLKSLENPWKILKVLWKSLETSGHFLILHKNPEIHGILQKSRNFRTFRSLNRKKLTISFQLSGYELQNENPTDVEEAITQLKFISEEQNVQTKRLIQSVVDLFYDNWGRKDVEGEFWLISLLFALSVFVNLKYWFKLSV